MLGRLRHDVPALVESLAPGAAGHLEEVAHGELGRLLPVELAELREQHGADGDVHPHAQRVGSAHHLEQALLRELLDQEPVARQEPGMVQADSVLEKALQLLAIGRVEAGPKLAQDFLEAQLLLFRGEIRRHEVLRALGRGALREVDQVHGRAGLGDELLERLVERGLGVARLQRYRPLRRGDAGHLATGDFGNVLLDRGRIAQRGAHEQELRLFEEKQRHLPGGATIPVGVVVELVHHHAVGAQLRIPQDQIREHLGGADEHRGLAIDGGVARDHPDVASAEGIAEREELLVDQRLDRTGVDGDQPATHGLEVKERGHQRLPRAGRRRQHQVPAREQLEQRFLLVRVESEALRGDPVGEAGEHGIVGQCFARPR